MGQTTTREAVVESVVQKPREETYRPPSLPRWYRPDLHVLVDGVPVLRAVPLPPVYTAETYRVTMADRELPLPPPVEDTALEVALLASRADTDVSPTLPAEVVLPLPTDFSPTPPADTSVLPLPTDVSPTLPTDVSAGGEPDKDAASTCKMCWEAKCGAVFTCGHAACTTCAFKISKCHLCRVPIVERFKLFLS